jgi:hypothetical protein
MGPAAVNITDTSWQTYLGYLDYTPDAISFHDYNTMVNGDLNQGRNNIEQFLGWLDDAGLAGIEMWQTEATHNHSAVFGTYHPRRARVTMMSVLLWEQYGIPAERNTYWYDYSIGFWGYPAFMFNGFQGDKTVNPPPLLWGTFAREVFGKAFHHRVDFGSVQANRMFVGNVYGDATAGSTMALMCASYMEDSTVTLTITGSSSNIAVVDSFGNVTSVAQASGRITFDVLDTPSYVRLPAGVNASVYAVRDWGNTPGSSLSAANLQTELGGSLAPAIADEQFMDVYTGTNTTGLALSTQSVPDAAVVLFAQTIAVERVIVWCGPFWQGMPGLYEYTLDTWDGADWTTQVTVSRSPGPSFLHGTDHQGAGCQMETYDPEQWIEDIALPSPIDCDGIRVSITEISYGGEPDLDRVLYGGFELGQGTSTPTVALQEVSVISPSTVTLPAAYSTTVLADSPVGYWRLGESSGTSVASETNSPTLDGTLFGGASLGADSLITDADTAMTAPFGDSGGATITYDALLDQDDSFSFEVWYEDIWVVNTDSVLLKLDSDLRFVINTSGILMAQAGATTMASSSVSLTPGQRYHCVFAKDGTTRKIYVNGVDVTSLGTNATISITGKNLTIGGDASYILDEAAIYSSALTAQQVLDHYLAGVAPQPPTNSKIPILEYLSADVGTQLSCLSGTWTGLPTAHTFQWQTSATGAGGWSDIAGETMSTYVIQARDVGDYLRCEVVASNAGGDSMPAASSGVNI